MDACRILVVEDDSDINALLCRILSGAGYWSDSAFSGTEAQLRLQMGEYDLLLLDLMLPGLAGEELIAWLRAEKTMPIIVISAKAGLDARVNALRLGADDFIAKPFENEEVLARVEAQLRRYRLFSPAQQSARLHIGRLTLDCETLEAKANGNKLSLTAREFAILELLMRYPRRVFTRENLYEQIWGEPYYGEDNTVNVHISNLRAKLHKADPDGEYIKTVWGIGFKMAQED
uniref:response regulator transcription factor n=1 Tax=Candidatus Fimivicinus sp. TaxID=3056640 RepID=UPI003FF061F2